MYSPTEFLGKTDGKRDGVARTLRREKKVDKDGEAELRAMTNGGKWGEAGRGR